MDKISPLRIDLDFLDTSGYVIIPIESPAIPMDAAAKVAERPFRKLQLVQTLDERQADKGKLLLEVKAHGARLVPELDQIVSLASEGFEVVKTDDQGVAVLKFDPESDTITIGSERTWMVTLKARDGLPGPPERFEFGKPKRWRDDDLPALQRRRPGHGRAGSFARAALPKRAKRPVALGPLVARALVLLMIGVIVGLCRPRKKRLGAWKLPDPLTPFTAIGFLVSLATRRSSRTPSGIATRTPSAGKPTTSPTTATARARRT